MRETLWSVPAATNQGKSMTETREATVPDIGDFTDVPVIEVLVKPGDRVEKDQGLVTLESAKATMEVPAPFAGVVREVKVKENDTVSRGSVIALIEEGAAPAKKAEAPGPVQAPEPAEKLEAKTEAVPPRAPAPQREEKPAPAPSGSSDIAPPRSPPVPFDAGTVSPDKVPYASPAVRAFARELGVDIARVHGSARGGRITKEDVQAFVKSALAGGGAPAHAAATGGGGLNLLPWPQVDFSKFGGIEEKPLSRIKKLSGANLARNWAMIPHVTQH